jgi:hypothetical protein
MGNKVEIAPIGVVDNSSFISKLNGAITELSDEFDEVLYRDGTTPMDGDLNMDGNRIYNLPAPISDHEPARLIDVETGLRGPPGPDTAEALLAYEAALAVKADLVNGVIPANQLPPIDTTGYRGLVATQAAMLATTATLGNYVIRTDTDPDTVWYLTALPSTQLSSWTQTGASASVTSVAGKTGVVALDKSDVGLGNVDNTSDANKPVSTAMAVVLAAKASVANPVHTGQVIVDYDGASVPAYIMRDQAGVRQGMLYWDNSDDKVKLRRYNTAGTIKEGELSISSTGIEFNGLPIGGGANTVKTFQDYSGVGDGAADDTTAVLNALQSGNVIDGLGKTYALSAEVHPSSFKGLRNATFKWISTAAMQVQGRSLLHIENLDDWFIDNCVFDMGTVENIGATGAPDNARGGLTVSHSTYADRCWITRCRATGAGAGTGLELRNLRNSFIKDNVVHDRIVAETGISNDAQNGIQIDNCTACTISGNIVTGLYLRIAGTATRKWSRGYCITSVTDSSFVNNSVSFVDQGFDFSGGQVPEGNRNLTITGCVANDVHTWGFKFANAFRDNTISGCTARRFGYAGFVFSGADAGATISGITQRALVTGCSAFDPTGSYTAQNYGFLILAHQSDASYPRGIKFVGCVANDFSGGGKLQYGFYNQATFGGFPFNELIDCRSENFTVAVQTGFPRRVCRLSGSGNQSIPLSVGTNVAWNVELEDSLGWHSNTTNPSRITIQEAGWYRVTGILAYATNANGFRSAGPKVGGSNAGAGVVMLANNSTLTTIPFSYDLQCAAGAYIEITTEQNSGAALNLDLANSAVTVEFLRYNY